MPLLSRPVCGTHRIFAATSTCRLTLNRACATCFWMTLILHRIPRLYSGRHWDVKKIPLAGAAALPMGYGDFRFGILVLSTHSGEIPVGQQKRRYRMRPESGIAIPKALRLPLAIEQRRECFHSFV